MSKTIARGRRAAAVLIAAAAAPLAALAAGGAAAELAPTAGNAVKGTVAFTSMGDHYGVKVALTGLPPNSTHGFHLHEKGDCSAPDAMSAGGHFNPGGKPHGPQDADHHAGDMPNLKSDASGKVSTEFMLRGISIGGGPADIVGRGVIVHAKADDYKTQPTGDSGARLACGVVKAD